VLERLGLRRPPNGTATSVEEAKRVAERIGYPVLVRPSFVLGGRAMEIVYDDESLSRYMEEATEVSPGRPVLIDKFLEEAIEVDVDAVSDGRRTVIGGIMQHVEEAGVHSGDSACAIPPPSLPQKVVEELRRSTRALAKELDVCGLINIQFAVKDSQVYVLEVNPRASRTVPFVSKATGLPLARVAALCMVGKSLDEQGVFDEPWPKHVSVKESVFPFVKFAGVDIVLGPEMRSTGEVMGIDDDFPTAFAKSQMAANSALPLEGTAFVSVAERDKRAVVPVAKRLAEMGFQIVATAGTARVLREAGVPAEQVRKLREGRPNILDKLANGEVSLVINTPSGKGARTDEGKIRAAATARGVTCITTIAAARAAVDAIAALRQRPIEVKALQDRLPSISADSSAAVSV
jgi:carbamoyl-phosphate synthase large subunit